MNAHCVSFFTCIVHIFLGEVITDCCGEARACGTTRCPRGAMTGTWHDVFVFSS
jgi:hypothetical protein